MYVSTIYAIPNRKPTAAWGKVIVILMGFDVPFLIEQSANKKHICAS